MITRPASHNRRPWYENSGDYRADTFCVSSEAKCFFDLWRRGEDIGQLRRYIMPDPLRPTTQVAMKRMQVLERFEWLVKRAEREERAA